MKMTQDKKRLGWVDARERRILSQKYALNFTKRNSALNEDLIKLDEGSVNQT
jgi:hypothetical protein